MIRPLRDHIVVEPAEISLSQTIIAKNKEPFNRGLVLAVGPGLRDKKNRLLPMECKPGQWVRYGNGTYLDWPVIDDDGRKVQMIREADIVGIESDE